MGAILAPENPPNIPHSKTDNSVCFFLSPWRSFEQCSMAGKINVIDNGDVVTLELDLNEKNTINSVFVEEITQIMDKYEKSDTIRVMIVTAKGEFFSNGFDPDSLLDVSGEVVEKNVGEAFRVLPRFYRLPFITVMAINGHCMGYGAVWALFFDYRFMADKGRFGYPEALIGLALPASTALLLKDLVGNTIARDLAVFGKGQKPTAAKELGLIDEVYAADELMTQANKFAGKFSKMSRSGLVGNKLSLKSTISEDALNKAIEFDYKGSRDMILSPDGQEGLRSIKEGRRPVFTS